MMFQLSRSLCHKGDQSFPNQLNFDEKSANLEQHAPKREFTHILLHMLVVHQLISRLAVSWPCIHYTPHARSLIVIKKRYH
jgi:hypothetical protein